MLVNSGVLPKEELPVLTPSFALPEPEGSGLGSVETVMEYQGRKNALDLPGMTQLLAEDVGIYMAPLDSTLDRGSAIAIHELMLLGIPDLAFAVQRTVDLGDGWLVVEATWRGTQTGPYLGFPATGRVGTVPVVGVFRVNEEGLLTYHHAYDDNTTILAQMGVFDPLRVSTQVTAEGVTLSWPLAASQGLRLETSTRLSGVWTPVTTPSVVEGDQYKVTVPITGDTAYFRLHTANP